MASLSNTFNISGWLIFYRCLWLKAVCCWVEAAVAVACYPGEEPNWSWFSWMKTILGWVEESVGVVCLLKAKPGWSWLAWMKMGWRWVEVAVAVGCLTRETPGGRCFIWLKGVPVCVCGGVLLWALFLRVVFGVSMAGRMASWPSIWVFFHLGFLQGFLLISWLPQGSAVFFWSMFSLWSQTGCTIISCIISRLSAKHYMECSAYLWSSAKIHYLKYIIYNHQHTYWYLGL